MSQPAEMSLPTSHPSPPKRPRLSLQIKASPAPVTIGKSVTALKADVDMSSPTAFNTLSNAYAAAIELSSPRTARPAPMSAMEPKTAINTAKPTSLRLVTSSSGDMTMFPSLRTQTPGPFTIVYPDTPTTFSSPTPITAHPGFMNTSTSTFTFTPPQSAHPSDEPTTKLFSFRTGAPEATASPVSPHPPRRRATIGSQCLTAPYTHPRTLHSILRNSPLPPRTAVSPMSPTRASKRLAERAAKRVGYNNPLTQTITNNKYVKSHIDLLAEEASPYSATDPEAGVLETLDLTMAYTGDETRDGGQTPGPFEEMRRRMAGLGAESDTETPGTRKRKRKEKKRQWIWTIGTNEEDSPGAEKTPVTARQVGRLEKLLPTVYVDTPADVEMGISESETDESEMSDVERPGSSHSI